MGDHQSGSDDLHGVPVDNPGCRNASPNELDDSLQRNRSGFRAGIGRGRLWLAISKPEPTYSQAGHNEDNEHTEKQRKVSTW